MNKYNVGLPKNEHIIDFFVFLNKKENTEIPFIYKLLRGLPFSKEELQIKGYPAIQVNGQITKLPDNLNINGGLYVEGVDFVEFPKNLKVTEWLHMPNCTIPDDIPSNPDVGEEIDFSDCNINKLPDNFTVKGALYLFDSTLKKLPKGLNVHLLDIGGCEIETLPADIKVRYGIDCYNSDIKYLPENFSVNGNLVLSGCKKLTKIPKGLEVQNSLWINRSGVESIPTDLKAGTLILGECPFYHNLLKKADRPSKSAESVNRSVADFIFNNYPGIRTVTVIGSNGVEKGYHKSNMGEY